MTSPPILTLRRFLGWSLSALCIGATLAYLVFQARFLITGPLITVTSESNGVYNTRVVPLSGTTHNIARLWLNDRPIFTDEAGNFNEALVLENGYTIATLRAEDRYGRTTRVEREFMFIPATFIP